MTSHWQNVLLEQFGITAELQQLGGECDLNFLCRAGDADYILKVMHKGCPEDLLDMQCSVLAYLAAQTPCLPLPKVNTAYRNANDETGAPRLIWLQPCLAGVCYAGFNPKTLDLIEQLGCHIGLMDKQLTGFKHPALTRDIKWKLPESGWISDHLGAIHPADRQKRIKDIIHRFQQVSPQLAALPDVPIHNDVNDYNILVTHDLTGKPQISGLIDFGDMTASPRVCELAIAGAYVVLDHRTPEKALAALVKGYHQEHPLTAAEIDLIWPLLRLRLAVSVVNAALESQLKPDDPYTTISQAPIWRFLEGFDIDSGLIKARLRLACGLPVTDGAQQVLAFLNRERGNFAGLFDCDISAAPMRPLCVAQSVTPQNPFDLPLAEAATLGLEHATPWLGYYGEPRLIYTADAFRGGPWKASNRRTVHLAIDVFQPAQTPLYTPLDGVVEVLENRTDHLDYGGVIILRHQTPEGIPFYTLYGHLDPAFMDMLKIGDHLPKGTAFCKLGDASQNGGWAPHVHFQLALTTDGMGHDWPGVGDPDDRELWGAICPNPAALLNLPDDKTHYQPMDKAAILEGRQQNFGQNLRLSYKEPALFLRGWQHHLFDEWGRPFLDAYNNVPHVGHAHPRIQRVAMDQLQRLNANTRYLHSAQTEFADKILGKLPNHLTVCYFTNSGSEANELALRLARAHTGGI